VTFYGDRVKMCEDFAPNFRNKAVSSRQRTTTHFFTSNFFTRNNMAVVCHPPYFSLFPGLKIIPTDRHFYTTEVIEAASQAVLNTLTEHDFQNAF
jgi:hypothetical protein